MPDDADQESFASGALAPIGASAAWLLAIAGLTWVASEAVPQPWSFLLALVTVAAGLLAAWSLFQLGLALVMMRLVDRALSGDLTAPTSLGKRFRLGFWPLIPVFILMWALNGVFLGFDKAQWTWTGISTLLACVAVIATSVRTGPEL